MIDDLAAASPSCTGQIAASHPGRHPVIDYSVSGGGMNSMTDASDASLAQRFCSIQISVVRSGKMTTLVEDGVMRRNRCVGHDVDRMRHIQEMGR